MSLKGYEGRLYAEVSGTYIEVDTVRDVTLTMEANEIDDTSRTTDGWRSRIQGLKQWGSEFEMIYNPTNTGWLALRTAYMDGEPISIRVLGEAYELGGDGLQGDVEVTNFTKEEPLEDVQTNSITLVGSGKPTIVSSGS